MESFHGRHVTIQDFNKIALFHLHTEEETLRCSILGHHMDPHLTVRWTAKFSIHIIR